ncbi:helix-turn-helix domain-containing protein [Streptomyces piniterrae]|uniref:Helix-turn-helix domain-containing protein n=1 Tax=Streptomyces piniterrae TaxID=2571125 RepID=A0A4V5MKM6_9ACTN|nr:helix-turn-helix transcriptional regulator [Streptomyces piniterrae]TJZ50108.1 helix-turn-helix domain-containing protein [Streptomyces piniterrae]
MADEPQLPDPYRYFGNQFQLWRKDAGVSRQEVGRAARYSVATVESVECGRRPVPPKLAEVADELFGARGKLVAGLTYLKKGKFPERSRDYFEFEEDAISVWSYQPLLIPGMLQTEEYVRALIGDHYPPLDDETAERRIRARLERQQLLTRTPPVDFNFVLYEAALYCPIGGAGVRRRQLLRLLEAGQLRNVSLQVLPFDRVAPAALNGPMVLLETPDHAHFALTEGQSTSNFTSDPAELSLLTARHGMIRTQALSVEESASFLERMVEKL